MDRQSCPSSEMLMQTSWEASGEALGLPRGAVASAVLEFEFVKPEAEQSGLDKAGLIPLGKGNESCS